MLLFVELLLVRAGLGWVGKGVMTLSTSSTPCSGASVKSSSDTFGGEPFSGSSIASNADTKRFAAALPPSMLPAAPLSARVGVALGPGVEVVDDGVGGGRANGSSCASFGSTSHSAFEMGYGTTGAVEAFEAMDRKSEPTDPLRRRAGSVPFPLL